MMDGDDHRTAIAADTDGLRGWSLRGRSLNLVPTYMESLNTLLNSHVHLLPHVETYQKAKRNNKRESLLKGIPFLLKQGNGNNGS